MAEIAPNHIHQDDKDAMSAVLVTTMLCGLTLLLGLSALLLAALDRMSSSGTLRGRFLSLPCCARCPTFRDCLLACGDTWRIQCLQLGAKDSVEALDLEGEAFSHYGRLRESRRQKPLIMGVRGSTVIRSSAPSGYKWKKKWRQRRLRSKQRRKAKAETRKLKRQSRVTPMALNSLPAPGEQNSAQLGPADGVSDPPARASSSSASFRKAGRLMRFMLRLRWVIGRKKSPTVLRIPVPLPQSHLLLPRENARPISSVSVSD